MKKYLADAFRKTVSGDPEGKPDWVDLIANGTGEPLFQPDSAVWQVHGSVSTLVGGIRALLLQAAHPAALTGVQSHSRYESDLFGRLQGTSRWLTLTTFGTRDVIEREAARVNAMHKKVSGDFINAEGRHEGYRAQEPRFLLWVHCAFTESFLDAHKICKYPLISEDQYVREWSISAEPLGLTTAPQSQQELRNEISRFLKEELTYTENTKKVLEFILKPPFPFLARFFYRPLAKTAVFSLSDAERALLRLKKPSIIWVWSARFNLWVLKKALGTHSPSQQAALDRIQKSGDERI